MAKNHRKRRNSFFSRLFKKALLATAVVALSAAVIVGFWLLSELGPKEVDYSNMELEPLRIKACVAQLALVLSAAQLDHGKACAFTK